MHGSRLVAGITLGDPAGIGPEVALAAVNSLNDDSINCVLIGRQDVLAGNHPGLFSNYRVLSNEQEFASVLPGKNYLYDVPSGDPVPAPGQGSVLTGLESMRYIDAALDLWKKKKIDYIVTGPVSKGLIGKAGFPFTGHTEYLADALGERAPYMMMHSEDFRVLLVTTHAPLDRVTGMITVQSILQTIRTGHKAILAIDGRKGKLAIAGLDPHCGDDGAIGDFDTRVTAAAVAAAREEGVDIEGPISADALFVPARWKRYNLAIAHYHDQGLIPFKMLAFETGVNVTLGLSMTRTSVDHGTAFDIAGKGRASYTSMVSAIRLGFKLETGRRGSGS